MYDYVMMESYVRTRCMSALGSQLRLVEVGCAKLGRKMDLSKKTTSSGKTGQFSGKLDLRPLEAEFGKSKTTKL